MPAWSESWIRRVAPTASGESRSRLARTGKPARAITVATPTVRSSVLLPDMFEPLTTSARTAPPRLSVVPHALARGYQGMAQALGRQLGRSGNDLGERVGRVLGGVGRQGAEGLELAHRLEPVRDGRPLATTPGVDGHGKLRPPEQDGGEGREELVLPGVQQVQ